MEKNRALKIGNPTVLSLRLLLASSSSNRGGGAAAKEKHNLLPSFLFSRP
jgi:hypothetical protein